MNATDLTEIVKKIVPSKVAFLGMATLLTVTNFAHAQNLVKNGGFSTAPTLGRVTPTTAPTSWTLADNPGAPSSGINFIFAPDIIGRAGKGAPYGSQTFNIWGRSAANGGNGGVYAGTLASMESPTGGNFFASDGDDTYSSKLGQSITGLTVGQKYSLSFDWAAGQQTGFDGATTERWEFGFGSESFTTPTLSTASHDFQPWRTQTKTFTATSATQVLSFIARGTPSGVPPFLLLDNVSLTSVPEPSAALLSALGLFGGLCIRRRKAH